MTEVLTVVAIVTVLAALSISVIAKAGRRGRDARCLGQLRQVGVALLIYANDSGRFPPGWDFAGTPSPTWAGRQTWADRLYSPTSLIWTNRSWHCPAYAARGGLVMLEGKPGKWNVFGSYAYNYSGMMGPEAEQVQPSLGLGNLRRSATMMVSSAVESTVTVPSEMYAVADTRVSQVLGYSTKIPLGALYGSYMMTPFQELQEEMMHGPGYNVLFVDGHVSLVPRRDYLFPPKTAAHWNRDNQAHEEAWAAPNRWAVRQ